MIQIAATSLNLRSDLARLSDDELAQRLDEAWRQFDIADNFMRNNWRRWFSGRPLFEGVRGPIRHPFMYRFWRMGADSNWLSLLLAALLSSKPMEPILRSDPGTDRDIALCEIRDLTDEVKRRVDAQSKMKEAP